MRSYYTKIVLVFLFLFAPILISVSVDSSAKTFDNVRPAPPKPEYNAGNPKKFSVKEPVRVVPKPGGSNIVAARPSPAITPASTANRVKTASVVPISKRDPISANLVTKDPTVRKRTVKVTQNEGFSRIMSKLGFNQRQIDSLSQRLARETGFVTTSARVGQEFILSEKIEGNKRKLLAIQIPTDRYNVLVYKNKSGLIEIKRDIRKDAQAAAKSKYLYKSGQVQTNISQLGATLGVPLAVANKAIRVLSGKINPAQIKRGDKLDMLYEYTYNNAGQQTGLRLLYINLVTKGQRIEGFRYSTDGQDTGEFFDPQGNSFAKSMLSSPLRGKHRITSGFGYRRHPILGRRMLHSGVDFGGRKGEPVYAAGDGTIDKIGRYGGYGNYIRVKHDGTWSTAYAHMNAYARGMYKWKRVRKGELIGYVGSTGRSTGNHLHFELIQRGTAIDPLRAKLPVGGKKLIGKDLYNFRQASNRVRSLVSQYRNAR